jgi:metal-responsive CopG/Arc/MetJ family transcriptional regulator
MLTKKAEPAVREIIGFSLTPELAAKVKTAARRRGLRLRDFFIEELWSRYQKSDNHPVADRVQRAGHGAQGPRQIVGISLPPELAAKVKREAERRRVSLRTLFQEMWSLSE